MKNVRIWFTKDNECRYISHLDLNRTMLRAVYRSKLPIWYTEGFNPHPFVTFPLPLTLGFRGARECMDVRLVSDSYDLSHIPSVLNAFLPSGLRVYSATEAVMKPAAVAFAAFECRVSCDTLSPSDILGWFAELSICDSVTVERKTKSGVKDFDTAPYLRMIDFADALTKHDGELCFCAVLPAGSTNNVNVTLLINAVSLYSGAELYCDITRVDLYDGEMKRFE